MKKIILGVLAGLILGAAGTYLTFRHPEAAAPPEKKPAETELPPGTVRLTREQQVTAGITVARPEPLELKPEIHAFGRVLEPGLLAAGLAEIETAQATADASLKEFERLRTLGDNAAVRALESAEAAMKRDRTALELARGRFLAAWGKELAQRPDVSELARALIMRTKALVRVDLPAAERLTNEPAAIRIAPLVGDAPFEEAEAVGPAPNADPQLQGQAFLALTHSPALAPGTALTASVSIPGAPQPGFRIPRGALVQHEGTFSVFIQTSEDLFVRKQVELGPDQRGGVFVTGGLAADDRLVTKGAQQLLSEELKNLGGGE